jgi:hypothetical protein
MMEYRSERVPRFPILREGRRWTILLVVLLVGSACAKASSPASSPSPSGSPLSLPALELAVLEAVGGNLAYCDPDLYPIPRGSPLENARARLPAIKADPPVFDAILQHEQLSASQEFTSDQLIAISNDYKQMQSIELVPVGEGYSFDLLVPQGGSDVGTWRLKGEVSRTGTVKISDREIGQPLNCPICLASGVRIATPEGTVRVENLRVGMPVWTTDLRGRRIIGAVVETGHMEAPLGHEIVRMTFADGRTLLASPGHPTVDGRTLADLMPGDRYDGTVVVSTTLVGYAGATWDLLPSGPTGTYFANGVPLASTLRNSSVRPAD